VLEEPKQSDAEATTATEQSQATEEGTPNQTTTATQPSEETTAFDDGKAVRGNSPTDASPAADQGTAGDSDRRESRNEARRTANRPKPAVSERPDPSNSAEVASPGAASRPANQPLMESSPQVTQPAAAAPQVRVDAVEPAARPASSSGGAPGEALGAARAANGSATRAAASPQGDQAPGAEQADRVRFVQRVARAFEAMGERNGSLRLRLAPPELGSLRLHLNVRNGVMTARLEVETATARDLLIENLPALRDRLAEHQIRVERFDVDFMDRSPGGSPHEPGGRHSPREQSRGGAHLPGDRSGSRTEAVEPGPRQRRGDPGRLDVTI